MRTSLHERGRNKIKVIIPMPMMGSSVERVQKIWEN